MPDIILASKSQVRRDILKKNNINCLVEPSNVDEEPVKASLIKAGASPEIISKNLAELKANKVSQKMDQELVLGADSVIDLNGELISKPENREEALEIFKQVCSQSNLSGDWNGVYLQNGEHYYFSLHLDFKSDMSM